MAPETQWIDVLGALCALMIACAGLSFILGMPGPGRKLLLLALGTATASALAPGGFDWRAWLPEYVDERAAFYVLCIVGFLVALNLLRHVLAFFVGYGAADAAVGGILTSAISATFAMLTGPWRALRRTVRRWWRASDDF